MTNNKRKIFLNISWSVLGKSIEIIRGLIIGVIVARYLKPFNYGVLNYAIGFCGMFILFTELGLSQILNREYSKKASNKPELIGTAMGIRLSLSVITIILIAILAFFIEEPTNQLYIFIYSLNFLFGSYTNPIVIFFRSQLKNEYVVKSEILRSIITITFKLSFVFLKLPVIYFIAIEALETLLFTLPLHYYFKKYYYKLSQLSFNKVLAKKLIFVSFPLLLEGISAIFYQKIDVFMAGKFINEEAVGYYSVALKFVAFALFIPLVLSQTFSPLVVSKLESVKNNVLAKDYILYKRRVSDIMISLGILITVALAIAAPFIIKILYGDEFLPAIGILVVLSVKGMFSAIGFSGNIIIVAEDKLKYVYLRNVIGAVLNVGLNILFIPKYGVLGIAYATGISYGVANLFANYFIPYYRSIFFHQINSIFIGPFRSFKYGKEIIQDFLEKRKNQSGE